MSTAVRQAPSTLFLIRNACICSCKGDPTAYDPPVRTALARRDTTLSDANARDQRSRRDRRTLHRVESEERQQSKIAQGRTITFVSAEAVARRLEFLVPARAHLRGLVFIQ